MSKKYLINIKNSLHFKNTVKAPFLMNKNIFELETLVLYETIYYYKYMLTL